MKNKKMYGLVGVAALAAVGGTFAYYNATDVFVNQFDTTNHSTSATEQFDPGKGHEWVPGAVVDKKVYATNTGDGDVWVRIKFDEVWSNLKSSDLQGNDKTKKWDSTDLTKFQPTSGITAGAHQPGENGPTNGLVGEDTGSVVYKIFDTNNVAADANAAEGQKWFWVDGYYYYCKPLTKNETTLDLLKQVKLCGDTDMGKLSVCPGYFTISDVVEEGQETPKPTLKDDGTLADNVTGWYPLAPDGSVPTKKVTNPDGSYYYIPVNITDLAEGASYDTASAVQDTELATDKTVYTYKSKVLSSVDQGYANANYNLNITVEFVQADEESAKAFPTDTSKGVTSWKWNPETKSEITY